MRSADAIMAISKIEIGARRKRRHQIRVCAWPISLRRVSGCMVPEPRPHKELNSWQDVASHLGVSVRTAQKWEKTLGLPIRRMPGPRGRIVADPAELDQWKLQAAVPSVKSPEAASRSKTRLFIFAALVIGMVALLLILLIRVWSGPTPSLLLTQITHSGFAKFAPIVSDGKQLFFTEQQNDRYWISTVPI